LRYAPGDALGVVAKNDPALAEELVSRLALAPGAPVPGADGEVSLGEALVSTYEITTLTPRFLEQYAELAGSPELRTLVVPENRADLRAWTAGRQIVDVVAEFPALGIDAKAFVAMLRKLQPRLYSIASSQAAFPDEAHLTVAVVRYESHGRQRQGTASSWLARQHDGADKVPVFIESNKHFKLPADPAAPIVMIGAGTGVAPFRAFMQEREAIGATGKNWLFFGDRNFRTDFLYQVEWQRLLKDGRLTRMDVAFSRDQAEKIYVQHRLLERGKEIYAWIEEGATLYVCGDASHLAPDVNAALSAILQLQGGMDAEAAEAMLKRLQQEKRYQRDVY
ncbi:MAG: sulfite reductase flavoprotein subunit alpha, partial [Betaproteobacteria bacterium]